MGSSPAGFPFVLFCNHGNITLRGVFFLSLFSPKAAPKYFAALNTPMIARRAPQVSGTLRTSNQNRKTCMARRGGGIGDSELFIEYTFKYFSLPLVPHRVEASVLGIFMYPTLPTLLACLSAMRQSYRYCSYGADRTCNRSGQGTCPYEYRTYQLHVPYLSLNLQIDVEIRESNWAGSSVTLHTRKHV